LGRHQLAALKRFNDDAAGGAADGGGGTLNGWRTAHTHALFPKRRRRPRNRRRIDHEPDLRRVKPIATSATSDKRESLRLFYPLPPLRTGGRLG